MLLAARIVGALGVRTIGRSVAAVAGAIAIGLRLVLRTAALLVTLLLRLLLLAFTFAVAPIVARREAAHLLDQAVIVIGVLVVGLGLDAIARSGRLAGQRLILVEDLMRISSHPDVGPAAVENLVSIGRTVRVVRMMLLVVLMVTTTATTTAATT